MKCPKCKTVDSVNDVQASCWVNVCNECGWLEIASVTLDNAGTKFQDRRNQSLMEKQTETPDDHLSKQFCFMCERSRSRLQDLNVKLLLGMQGGICIDCVGLCQQVIDEDKRKPDL